MYDPQGSINMLTSTHCYITIVVHLGIERSHLTFTLAVETIEANVASINGHTWLIDSTKKKWIDYLYGCNGPHPLNKEIVLDRLGSRC